MTEKEIMREVMRLRGCSQSKLAEKAGFNSQLNISGLLNNNKNGIRIDKLLKVFTALDCEIVVRDKTRPGFEWVITPPEEVKIDKLDLDELLKDN